MAGSLSTLTVSLPVRAQLRTSDVEAAHAALSRMYAEHVPEISGDRERFRFESLSTWTNVLGIDHGRHTLTVDTATGPLRALHVTRVVRGRLGVSRGPETLRALPGDVFVSGPDVPYQVHWSDLRWQVVRLDAEATCDVAAGIVEADGLPARFALSRPLSAARLHFWQSVVDHVRVDVLDVPQVAASALARSEAFRLVASATLHAFPNSALAAATDPMRRGPGRVEPAVLRRAMAFIDECAGEPIGLAQIAAAARVGARGLQQVFRRHRDTTPLEYVRTVRMERAHADLVAADPAAGDTVAAVAARWGFVHHGHFAADYRRRFGCSPSTTLRGN